MYITTALKGCKESHFYSLPFRQAEANPTVISTSPESFLTSYRIDFTVLSLFELLKKHHLPFRQVKNRID